MGKKGKIGKGRRDKAYWAAKEIGYRSRASFKLIQLNRKWEFLQKSSVCIDLCAAPGSWMQVCRQNMPLSSLVIGIDLNPIKPIPNTICLQEDITTEKCKSQIKNNLKTAKADLVLHDGAPNVGANWTQDAYDQNVLTLSAFKLATCFLSKGGYFVTKVFRSKDYQALLWVFGQFFKKVHATKPAASRNESAEIFVVCQFYLAPEKVDPKFLDPKHVFRDIAKIDNISSKILADPRKESLKRQRQGYEDEAVSMLYKEVTASQFIIGDDAIAILNSCNSIAIDKPWIKNHHKSTPELQECLKDLKVLNLKDLRMIKKWRDVLKTELERATEEEMDEAAEDDTLKKKTKEQIEADELEEIENRVEEVKEEERRKEKRKRRKEKIAQEKAMIKLNLKMVIPGDQGPRAEDIDLFKLTNLKTNKDLNTVLDANPDEQIEFLGTDEIVLPEKQKYEKFDRHEERDTDDIWFEEHDDVIQESSDEYESEEEPEKENLDLERSEDEDDEPAPENYEDEDPHKDHPIYTSLSNESNEERAERKAEMWFQKIGDIEEDSDLEDAEMEKAVTKVQERGGKLREKEKTKAESGYTSGSDDDNEEDEEKQALDLPRPNSKNDSDSSDSNDSSDYDSDTDEDTSAKGKKDAGGFQVVPQGRKRKALTPEQLALGEDMIYSKKRKRDIMDAGWNRYMFNDVDLPDWFYKDQQKFYQRQIPVDPEVVAKYKARDTELNVKTIKKVVEAKARRKRRAQLKLEKAKKKTSKLLEDEDTGTRDKLREINKLYKSAEQEKKRKQETKYVVAKKRHVGKALRRPAGHKGPYKQVDARQKKDNRGKRDTAGKAGPGKGKKRGRKGKTSAARQK